MTQRKHKPWELAAPIWLDGSGKEVPRTIDLVICPECLAVRYIGHSQVEERTFTRGLFEETAKGVFCPGCDQLLFDEQAWIKHLAAQQHYDDQLKAREEAERTKRTGPQKGAAAPSSARRDAAPEHTDQRTETVPLATSRARSAPGVTV